MLSISDRQNVLIPHLKRNMYSKPSCCVLILILSNWLYLSLARSLGFVPSSKLTVPLKNKKDYGLEFTIQEGESKHLYNKFETVSEATNGQKEKRLHSLANDSIIRRRRQENICVLTATNPAGDFEDISKKEYNFVHLRLNFVDLKVSSDSNILNSRRWVWTFEGVMGASQYLYWPQEAWVWSFGLLDIHTMREPPVNIRLNWANGDRNCENLRIGSMRTNYQIGNALRNMVKSNDTRYRHSFWCYVQITPNWHRTQFCKYLSCPFEAVQYKCCSVRRSKTKNSTSDVFCSKDGYQYDFVWWIVPFITGTVMFLCCPLVFLFIVQKLQSSYTASEEKAQRTDTTNTQGVTSAKTTIQTDDDDVEVESDIQFVTLSDRKYFTFISSIFGPLGNLCVRSSTATSRFVRFLFPFFTFALIGLQIVLDSFYFKDLITECVAKNISYGFRSVIAGFEESSRVYLVQFGGPYIALGMYIAVSWIFLLVPRQLSAIFEGAIKEEDGGLEISILCIGLKQSAKYGSVSVRDKRGYQRLQYALLSQFYMLLNSSFWKKVFTIFKQRFIIYFYGSYKDRLWRNKTMHAIVLVLTFPIYCLLCAVELLLLCLLFGIPAFGYMFLFTKAFCCTVSDIFPYRRNFKRIFCRYMSLTFTVTSCVFLCFMHGSLFLESLVIVSRFVVYTYTGIIAYPRDSYGYMVFIFMAIYYLAECSFNYKDVYARIHTVLLHYCDKLQKKWPQHRLSLTNKSNSGEGIRLDLFEYVVEHTRPRRIQIFHSIVRFLLTVSILAASVEMILRFHQFKELSVLGHVMSALFICALPKVFHTVFRRRLRALREQDQLKREVKKAFYMFVTKHSIVPATDN